MSAVVVTRITGICVVSIRINKLNRISPAIIQHFLQNLHNPAVCSAILQQNEDASQGGKRRV
jgi:hypothetical protein